MSTRRKIWKIILLFSWCFQLDVCLSQHIFKLQDLVERNVIDKSWETDLPIQPDQRGSYVFAVLKNGVVAYSPIDNTIACYDFNNQLKWKKPALEGRTAEIAATLNGELIYTSNPLNEVEYKIGIWTSNGELLWSAIYEGNFTPSPSGKFLVSYYSKLEPRPLKIIDIKTGKILWENTYDSYWQCTASGNDKIAYYNDKNTIKFYEIKSGELIWERSIEGVANNGYGNLNISKEGNLVIIQDHVELKERMTFIFDSHGVPLWQMRKPWIPNKSNGGIVKAVSENGDYFAVGDMNEFSIYSTKTLSPIWTLSERIRPQIIQKFTNEILAFVPSTRNTTRVLFLGDDGNIINDYTFAQVIEFKFNKIQNDNLLPALVVDKNNGLLKLAKYDLKINE